MIQLNSNTLRHRGDASHPLPPPQRIERGEIAAGSAAGGTTSDNKRTDDDSTRPLTIHDSSYRHRHQYDDESILKTALAFVVLRRRVRQQQQHGHGHHHGHYEQQEELAAQQHKRSQQRGPIGDSTANSSGTSTSSTPYHENSNHNKNTSSGGGDNIQKKNKYYKRKSRTTAHADDGVVLLLDDENKNESNNDDCNAGEAKQDDFQTTTKRKKETFTGVATGETIGGTGGNNTPSHRHSIVTPGGDVTCDDDKNKKEKDMDCNKNNQDRTSRRHYSSSMHNIAKKCQNTRNDLPPLYQQPQNPIQRLYYMALSTAWPLYHSYIRGLAGHDDADEEDNMHHDDDDQENTQNCLYEQNDNSRSVRKKMRRMTTTMSHAQSVEQVTNSSMTKTKVMDADVAAISPAGGRDVPPAFLPIYDCHSASLTISQIRDKLLHSVTPTRRHQTTKESNGQREYSYPRYHGGPCSSLHTYAALDGIVSHLGTTMVGSMRRRFMQECAPDSGSLALFHSLQPQQFQQKQQQQQQKQGKEQYPFGMFYHEILLPTLMTCTRCDFPVESSSKCIGQDRAAAQQMQKQLQSVLSMSTVLHRLVFQKGSKDNVSSRLLMDDLIRGLCRVLQCVYMGHGWFADGMGYEQLSFRDERCDKIEHGDRDYVHGVMDTEWKGCNMADVVTVNVLVLLEEIISFRMSVANDVDQAAGVQGGFDAEGNEQERVGGTNCFGENLGKSMVNTRNKPKRVSETAEQILRVLNSVFLNQEKDSIWSGCEQGLFLPVVNRDMAAYYLQNHTDPKNGRCTRLDQELRTVYQPTGLSRRSYNEEEKQSSNPWKLNNGARMMIRMCLFDLVQKLSSYHVHQ